MALKAVVVGGGIGGLATAYGLQRAGWEAIVLERSAAPQQLGSGLSLFGNGFRALDSLGLGAAVRGVCADSAPYQKSGIRTPQGRRLVTFAPAATADLRVVDRTELHEVLLDSLTPGSVHWGEHAVAVTDGSVKLEDGSLIGAVELIIGADGIHSRIRASLPQNRGTRHSGYGAWRAITSRPLPVDVGGETWGAGERFGIAPLRDGRVYWFAVATDARFETGADALAEVRRRFGSWHEPIGALIDATESDAVHYLSIDELARPLPSYVHGHTVLIGDAAHAMTPNLGQGANQALEDAATLCALLTVRPGSKEQGLRAALRQYDRLRRPRTQRITRESRRIGTGAQWRNPLAVRLRDAMLSVAPDRIFDHWMTRLQRWEPTSRNSLSSTSR